MMRAVNQPHRRPFSLTRVPVVIFWSLPALAAVYMMWSHWVPVPYWDEWDSPGQQLAAYYRGTLGLTDLFSQHNESRSLFPRLLYLSLYLTAGWDVRCGMVATFVLACAA